MIIETTLTKISKKVQDISIKRNAEDYLKRMKPIAVALDKVQSDTCKIRDAVEVWKELSHDTSPGIVHSKLRNRLGADKAGKLVFIYKLLNQRC